jgi:hypothetical protein
MKCYAVKSRMDLIFLVILCLIFSFSVVSSGMSEPCKYFYGELVRIPHKKIAFEENTLISDLDGREFVGCKIIFNSHIELMIDDYEPPSFWAYESSELYEEGWRIDHNYTADGPGSGKYAIANNSIICIIDWDRHAWIDDKTGEIMQSDLINMEIQCLDKDLPDNQSSGGGKTY